jgi:hypothetical protein
MFLAAFTSRSWLAPQEEHSHALIPSPVIPFGRPLDSREPQQEQVWAVNRSSTSTVLLALVAGGVNRIGTLRSTVGPSPQRVLASRTQDPFFSYPSGEGRLADGAVS